MGLTVVLPSQLRELTGGRGTIELGAQPGTVGAALEELRRAYPAVYDRILTERHEIRPHVNLFVGRDDIRWSGGLETPVQEGSELVVIPSVSGG
jgi:sulfur-carrier protein